MSVRVGVDVGGTFTKAIAFDTDAGAVVANAIVPTTHEHVDGVAAGVVDVVNQLAREVGPDRIELVTHSTTQAVNALLEGDGAKVGMIGMGRAPDLRKARKRTIGPRIELSEGRTLAMVPEFLDVTNGLSSEVARATIARVRAGGAEAIAVAEAFAPDDVANEATISAAATEAGLPVTTSAELTGLYGLELRSVTAALNASILPIALRTAEVVGAGVAAAGITSPVMVMRGDGGATDLSGFRRAPAAHALLRARGVGGRRAAIEPHRGRGDRRGRWHVHQRRVDPARAARALVRADRQPRDRDPRPRRAGARCRGRLDVARPPRPCLRRRTAERAHRGAAVRVLPARRRFHRRDHRAARAARGRPRRLPGRASGRRPRGRAHQHLRGERARPRRAGRLRARVIRKPRCAAFAAAGATLRLPAEEVARRMLAASTQAIGDLVASVIHDHHLERPVIVAVGGGAGGLGRAVAGAMKLDIVVPESAEVISAIGDALSLVRAERERTFNQPTPAELQALVAEVEAEAILAGASASTLDVRVEQVVERGAVRVTVTGAVGLNSGAVPGRQPATRAEVSALAAARQYADVAPLGQYWFATRLDHGGNVAVFDLYGDLVIDVAGETVDASGATPEGIEAAIARRTKRVGPVSIAPDVWVIGGARFLQVADTDPRAVLETAATLTDGGSDATIIIGRT